MARRTYNQYCATARTLDLVGDRWTLLMIRELLTGPKRFGDLLDSLRGIGTGLLSARLKYLEAEGLIRHSTLPPPARTPAYELTEAGTELGPAVMALARWGTRWVLNERREGEHFRPGWALLAMEAMFDPIAGRNVRAVYEFRVDDEAFHARIDHGAIELLEGPAQGADATIQAGADVCLDLAAGRLRLVDALQAGTASVSGDAVALRELRGLFKWPEPGQLRAQAI